MNFCKLYFKRINIINVFYGRIVSIYSDPNYSHCRVLFACKTIYRTNPPQMFLILDAS